MLQKYAPVVAAILMASAAPVLAQTAEKVGLEKIAPYPAADAGMVRQVITLPAQENEDLLRVEIVAGKVLEVDCNRVMISAQLNTKTLEGWGYEYQVLDAVSQPATTMMACPDNKKEERFVPLNLGAEATQRYNSKLPIVVYAPEDVAVKYRIWRADEQLTDAVAE